ncbi:heavy-metal-associated domain-containing protein [Flaviaesturariibacter aridisoli]|uniref:Copper chaperone n=1 Tax=Flaviaesturariibacter aridisoli TaxID=2545761 RepID=A0A4R4E2T1_9BACT|nr:heavy-metal-associated domain-containing protein [Flaviaesturariibacter aridisoli]TCZ69892.1 copper chaperone [Flaviaesturariibacter aridisoli]
MKLQFKTNINCGGCVAAVTPRLNEAEGIRSWKVDTQSPDKVLTVEAEGLDADTVCRIVQKAGFTATTLAQ